jgi:hypothetical protein
MNTTAKSLEHLSISRLVVLCLSSVLLSISVLMSLFAPFPLALAISLYGRQKGIMAGSLTWLFVSVISIFVIKDIILVTYFGFVFMFALILAEIVIRKSHPLKSMVLSGVVVFSIIIVGSAAIFQTQNISLKKELVKQFTLNEKALKEQKDLLSKSNEEGAFETLALLDNPDKIADVVIESLPSYLFVGIFFILWANLFLLVKGQRLMKSHADYPFTEKVFLDFKVKDWMIWPFIACLLVYLFGDQYISAESSEVGLTGIKMMSVFYFFQGFGVFVKFLNYIKVYGLIRTFVIMFTIFSAAWLIAAIGLFDLWINFERFFKKKDKN